MLAFAIMPLLALAVTEPAEVSKEQTPPLQETFELEL